MIDIKRYLSPYQTSAWHVSAIAMLLVIGLLWYAWFPYKYFGIEVLGFGYVSPYLLSVVKSLIGLLRGKRAARELRFGADNAAVDYREMASVLPTNAVALVTLLVISVILVIAGVLSGVCLVIAVVLLNISCWFALNWAREMRTAMRAYKAAERLAARAVPSGITANMAPFLPGGAAVPAPRAPSARVLIAGRKVVSCWWVALSRFTHRRFPQCGSRRSTRRALLSRDFC